MPFELNLEDDDKVFGKVGIDRREYRFGKLSTFFSRPKEKIQNES